ncbi:DUF4340 domain-containing protein [Pseudodesulfovibrio thermohalotolerans]|uniref:DUF4340 domain-containing protein n=1 Tax=Pseudodesulfovibrio thermohalotolerans TaxID=2880651 RepID=UPI00244104DB|nr:DUF4340 domain-containing protein [Pseudodesulfovibrio thermohalotolerans]WFS61093.1 DUF4340 domain-containing protein [Pseudodesulfovibrio thermohalotolerans]
MRRLLFLVAIVLAASLAGGAYWYRTSVDERVASFHWLGHPLDKAESVQVVMGSDVYTLVARDRLWDMRIPGGEGSVSAKALRGRVRDYLERISQLAPLLSLEGEQGDVQRQYGLEEPGLMLVVRLKDVNAPLSLRFSKDETGRTYGWNSETPDLAFEFVGDVYEQLALPAAYFLDTRVFRFNEEKVNQVQLVQPFGSSWVVKRGKNGFYFTLPGYLKDKEAADSELKLYVHALALLRAGKLVLEPEAEGEKGMAALTIKVWSGNAKKPSSVEFFPIEGDPKHFYGRSSWLTVPFLLDAESVSQLVKSAFDVQGRNVFTLDIGQVATFVVTNGERRYAVVREDAGWRSVGTEKVIPGIDMALWRFTELQFEALPLNNLAATAVKLMHCRLLDRDGNELKEITFYADPKLPQGQCWMKNGDGMYYPVSARLLKDLQGMFPAGPIVE